MYYDPVGARARYEDYLREADTTRLMREIRKGRPGPFSRLNHVRMRIGGRLGGLGMGPKQR